MPRRQVLAGIGAAVVCLTLLPAGSATAATPAPWHPSQLRHLGNARQVIVVNAADWSTTYATLRRYEFSRGAWQQVGAPVSARIGRSGFEWAGNRTQGTGETPAGTFSVTQTFGAFPKTGMKIPYTRVDGDDFWPYDPRDPKTYNVLQKTRTQYSAWRNDGNWSERLQGYGAVYHNAAVINYNTPAATTYVGWKREWNAVHPVNTAKGGGIFLHASSGRPTAGCVAVGYFETGRIISWLDASKNPRIVMAPTAWLKYV